MGKLSLSLITLVALTGPASEGQSYVQPDPYAGGFKVTPNNGQPPTYVRPDPTGPSGSYIATSPNFSGQRTYIRPNDQGGYTITTVPGQ